MSTERINCGEFTEMVTLLRPEKSRRDSGEVNWVYTSAGKVLARVRQKTLGEEADMAITLESVQELTTYLYREVDNAWRVVHRGVAYEILSVEELQRMYMRVIIKKL